MGTDIHFFVERRRFVPSKPVGVARPIGGVIWEVVPPPDRDLSRYPITATDDPTGQRPWWGPGECMRTYPCDGPNDEGCLGDRCSECGGHKRCMWWYRNRNYSTFAILANVRNDYKATPVVDVHRGRPADCSPLVRSYSHWDHSITWLSLAEVLAYDWSRATFYREGLLPLVKRDYFVTYDEWVASGRKPLENWIDSKYPNRNVTVVEPEEADRMLAAKGPSLRKHTRTEVRVRWETSAVDDCGDFLAFVDELVEPLLGEPYLELKRVWQDAVEGGPGFGPVAVLRHQEHVVNLRNDMLAMANDVRFVFGFDS